MLIYIVINTPKEVKKAANTIEDVETEELELKLVL